MKTSFKILKCLSALFLVAISLAAIGVPELFGAFGLTAAFPLILANYPTSDDAKQKRSEVIDRMELLMTKAKTENRSLSTDERKEFNSLKADADKLTEHIEDVKVVEDQRTDKANKMARKVFGKSEGNDSGWLDFRTMSPIKTFQRGQNLADSLPQEQRNLSMGRYIQALITGNSGFAEREMRAMSKSVGSAGVTVPIGLYGSIIDRARELSLLGRSKGLQTVPMPHGNMTVAKFTSDPVYSTKAENADINLSDIITGTGDLKAKTFAVIVPVSRELAHDSVNFVTALERALSEALALKLDAAFMFGDGEGTDPLGLVNTSGVQEIQHDGPLDYDTIIDAWQKLAAVNADPQSLFMSPRDRSILTKISKGDSGYFTRPELLNGIDFLHSAAIPSNLGVGEDEGLAIMGDFSQALLGITENAQLEITTTGGDAFRKHQVLVKMTYRGDILALRPNHFLKITGTSVIPAPVS